MSAYYSEFEPYAAEWLRNLIKEGLIADGEVDTRSIVDVRADDIRGFTQCHFFAGIGVWSYALRLAGWGDDRPVWTGSCPCQPFSAAGQGKGIEDHRHLWPEFYRLIGECLPPVVFGEQVASKDGLNWLDHVSTDMEATGYAFGAVDLCAAGVGAPHIRQRLWFVGERLGNPDGARGTARVPEQVERQGWHPDEPHDGVCRLPGSGAGQPEPSGMGEGWERVTFTSECDPDGAGWCEQRDIDVSECDCIGPTEAGVEYREVDGILYGRRSVRLADAGNSGFQGGKRDRETRTQEQPGRHDPKCDRFVIMDNADRPSPTNGNWRDADWLHCRDGKWRPVEPGTFPLAHGAPSRVGRLRAYGNAIVPQVAAEVIAAYMEVTAQTKSA